MKDYYFFVSLPRAGNTLLGTLINQNPNVCCTANSLILDFLWQNETMKDGTTYQNFPDESSFNNVQKNIIHNYYKDFTANKIIERSSWATPTNLKLLTDYITPNPKFIILYRPLVECFASFMKAEAYENEDVMINQLMDVQGFINMTATSIVNVLQSDHKYLFLTYKELVAKPVATLKKIFNYIDEEYKPIKTKNFDQFSANGIVYDDSVLFSDHHTIRTDKIKNENIKVDDYLSDKLIAKATEWDEDLMNLYNEQKN